MAALLSLEGVSAGYGGLMAVRDVSLEVGEGEIVALIGANGAGKTTTLRAISGLIPARAGRIALAGERLDGRSPADVVARSCVALTNVTLVALTPPMRTAAPAAKPLPLMVSTVPPLVGPELGETPSNDGFVLVVVLELV